jgi:hypothetical protein
VQRVTFISIQANWWGMRVWWNTKGVCGVKTYGNYWKWQKAQFITAEGEKRNDRLNISWKWENNKWTKNCNGGYTHENSFLIHTLSEPSCMQCNGVYISYQGPMWMSGRKMALFRGTMFFLTHTQTSCDELLFLFPPFLLSPLACFHQN